MTVCFISLFPIHFEKGGVQRVTSILARGFTLRGHKVIYLILEKGEFELVDGISQYFLPETFDKKPTTNIEFAKRLLKEQGVQIIINQVGLDGRVLDFLGCLMPSDIRIFTVHHNCVACLQANYQSIILSNEGLVSSILKRIGSPMLWAILKKYNRIKYAQFIRKSIQLSEKLVLLSDKFIPELRLFIPSFDESKVTAITNPGSFAPQPHALENKENRILYIGRLEYAQKQANLLIDIWEKFCFDYPDWHLDILGEGSKLEELKRLAENKGLLNIHFLGFQNPESFLKKSKLLLLPSAFEGFGMVLAEAQAFGVVPVAFHCFSSIDDIVPEGTGIKVPSSDTNSFTAELKKLMENPGTLNNMAKKALENSSRFSADAVIDQWEKLFKN